MLHGPDLLGHVLDRCKIKGRVEDMCGVDWGDKTGIELPIKNLVLEHNLSIIEKMFGATWRPMALLGHVLEGCKIQRDWLFLGCPLWTESVVPCPGEL